jgi:mono/diheme cytochrome c family protein
MGKITPARYSIVVLILLMGVTISACSGTANNGSPTSEATPVSGTTAKPSPSVKTTATSEVLPESSTTAEESDLSETTLDGRVLLETRCTQCHNLNRVENAFKTLEEWRANVERMVGKGAVLNETELETLIEYLSDAYP